MAFVGHCVVWSSGSALEPEGSEGMRFEDALLRFFDVDAARIENADEVLAGVVRMREEDVQGGVVDWLGAEVIEQVAEGVFADSDIDAEHAIAIEVGNVIVIVVGVRKRHEGQAVIAADEEKRVTEVLFALDVCQFSHEGFEFCLRHGLPIIAGRKTPAATRNAAPPNIRVSATKLIPSVI